MDILFDPNKNRMTNMQLCRLYMDEFVRSSERKWMLDGGGVLPCRQSGDHEPEDVPLPGR